MKIIIIITEKLFTKKMKKGDLGMANRFSKKYGNKGLPFYYLQSDVKMPVST